MSSAKVVILAAAIAAIAAAAGCGGGDGGESAPSPTGGGSGTAYDFVPPKLNSMRSYSETIVDNSNNTIDIGYSDETTAVNSDGSYSVLSESSTGKSTVVNGTNYAMPTESQNYDPMGQETSYNYTESGNVPVTCTFEPHGSGPDYPLLVGDTWMLTFTVTCGSGSPVTYTQSGSVVDVESVTVPAGTYTAVKLQSTLTWTDAEGTTRTQTITNWRDVATSYSVKQSISVAYSGVLPTNGYAVSRELLLESTS
jgi:hypothetical protein